MNLSNLYTSASGEFKSLNKTHSLAADVFRVPVFNPGVLEHQRGSYRVSLDTSDVDQWLKASTGEKKWTIESNHLDAYSDTAVKLASAIVGTNAQCRLGPLRGAARPCLLVEVMSLGSVEFDFFNFKEGSSGKRTPEIRKELLEILSRRDPGHELYRIQIVDTAIGGYGVNSLVELLRDIHNEVPTFQKQSWIVDIHLLHPVNGNEDLKKIEAVQDWNAERFQVLLTRYPVPDLIVEDYDEALGFTLEKDGGIYIAKPSVVAGRFLLKTGETISLIESEDLSRTFDEFMCEAVTNSLLTDPDRELVRVVWQDYTMKS